MMHPIDMYIQLKHPHLTCHHHPPRPHPEPYRAKY
jgi:hypothetical protein